MTVAQQLRKEGEKAGILLGMERGIEKCALDMLKRQVDINFIQDITGLSLGGIYALYPKLH